MAILPTYYNGGTVSVTGNSTAVTGVGTAWVQRGVQANDIFWQKGGIPVRIASVTDDTHLVLSSPWTGPTTAGTTYEIWLSSDTQRLSGLAVSILQKFSNGNLDAINGLTFANGKLIVGTGAGTVGLIDLSDIELNDPNGTLATFAALSGAAANKIAYFVSGTALGLTDISSSARAFLAQSAIGDRLVYYTGATTVGLAAFTALGRTLAAATQPSDIMTATGIVPNRIVLTAGSSILDNDNSNPGSVHYAIGGGTVNLDVSSIAAAFGTRFIFVTDAITTINFDCSGVGTLAFFGMAGDNITNFSLPPASVAYLTYVSGGKGISVELSDRQSLANVWTNNNSFGRKYSATGANAGWTHRTGDGVVFASRETTGSASVALWYNPNGNVGSINLSGSGTIYGTTSDESYKIFKGEYSPLKALDIIKADPVREFTWKASGEFAIGWGAQTSYKVSQDLACPGGWVDPITREECSPSMPGAEYVPWSVDFGKRTPYLWAVVPWMEERISQLENTVALLTAQINMLASKIDAK